MSLGKKKFTQVFKLLRDIEWLIPKEDELLGLIKECKSERQETLISDLLYRFLYLTLENFSESLEKITSMIIDGWKLNEDDTQIVAITDDDDADSSQFVLHFLKTILVENGWERVKLVNRIGRSVKNIIDYPSVVFIDEFIGTGNTIWNRVNSYQKKYREHIKQKNIDKNFNIYVASVTCMKEAQYRLFEKGVNLFSVYIITKGINDYYKGKNLRHALIDMWELEKQLDHNNGKEDFKSFGWGAAEALYCLERQNIPNSVFPVFWWKHSQKNKIRKTLFNRF